MKFARRKSHITTHFSERIPVIKRHISVLADKHLAYKTVKHIKESLLKSPSVYTIFPEMWGISWLAANQLASQEGLSTIQQLSIYSVFYYLLCPLCKYPLQFIITFHKSPTNKHRPCSSVSNSYVVPLTLGVMVTLIPFFGLNTRSSKSFISSLLLRDWNL